MMQAANTLAEQTGGRFLLGMGVSHQPLVGGVRGHDYRNPLSFMRTYLEAMDRAPFMAAQPPAPPRRVLAALHPRMLELARERSWGSHSYFVTPEHTARARKALGNDRLLAPEQAVLLETNAATARTIARQHMAIYLGLPNYRRNLLTLGFSESDLDQGGSDRLVDAIVAWGDVDTVCARVRAHHDAGADHVCLQALTADMASVPRDQWRALAAALL
jgi:probable F420-dependent oxidoreductase